VIAITTPDAAVAPSIVSNYLAVESDQRVLVDGLKLARRIAAQEPFARYVRREYIPGREVATDADILAFARAKGTTIFHPCGSCKMGSDPMAVVDERLRVHGIAGLRVIDASIMPTMTSGNTNAPTIMIGEKAADMIRADAKAEAQAA
jgi:choline dehydrogenase